MDETIGRNPPPPQKKSSKVHRVAILVPHDELVMKSYIHIWLAIVETHYHNLNANNKNQVYWLLTSNVRIKMQKGTKLQHRTKKKTQDFLISHFRHVLNVVCFLLGNSPASEFYVPTIRNTLSFRQCSEMSAYKIQTPGNYPEESIQTQGYFPTFWALIVLQNGTK